MLKRKVGVGNYPSLKPKRSLQRQIKPNKKKSKAQKARELWGQYGLEVPKYIRYSGLGGILWYLTSQYVRQEEFKLYSGRCVDGCGVEILDWHEADCGHFRSAKSLATRGGNGRQYDFGLEIDKRYGKGTADELTELAKGTSIPFSKDWYHQEILKIQALLDGK